MPDEKLIDLEVRYYDNEDYDEHFKDLLEAMNEGTLGDGGGESGGGDDPAEKVAWSDITGTPTTLDGYGITDAVKVGAKVAWSDVENAPTTLEGYGITDAVKVGDKINWSDIESAPTTLEGYGITDAVKASDTQQAITADTVTANTFTGALTGNAATATKLEAPVNVTFSGVTADAATFDGSADLNVNVTAVPASLVTGVLSEANIPASIVSTLKTVNNDEERFALTIDDVQNGDTVYVAEPAPGKMYRVVDDTKLNEEAGYQEFSAGIADKALADSEGNVITETYLKKTDAASTYAAKTELTSAVETLNSALDGKQAIGDYALKSDLSSYATTESVTSGLAAKADASALSGYATTSALTDGLAAKADTASLSNYATTTALTEGLATKANAADLANYATTESVTSLSEKVDTKADSSALSSYATTQALTEGLAGKVDTATLANYATTETVEAGLSAKADTSALADYVTNEELTAGLAEKADASALSGYATTQSVEAVNSALEGKANAVHTHVAADITDMNTLLDSYVTTEQLSTQLAGKADTVHTHVTANITDFAEVMAGYVTTSSLEESLAAKADSTELSAYALKSELGDYATSESVTSGLAGKADAVHTHTKSDIIDFPTKLSQFENDLTTSEIESIAWEKVTGKPESFTPSAHTHVVADITDLDVDELKDVYVLNGLTSLQEGAESSSILAAIGDFASLKQAIVDKKVIVDYKQSSNVYKVAWYSVFSNDVAINIVFFDENTGGYTIYQIQNASNTLALGVTKRTYQEAGDYVESSELTSALEAKADVEHTHVVADVTDLADTLDDYALKTDVNKLCIYNMGNFETLDAASERACNGGVYDNLNYRFLLFTVNNQSSGIIVNNVDYYKTEQYLYYDMHRYTRRFTRGGDIATVTPWRLDDYVSFSGKGIRSDLLFALTKESSSDDVKAALTYPNGDGVLTKDDLETCLEKGLLLKDYDTGGSSVFVNYANYGLHYIITCIGYDDIVSIVTELNANIDNRAMPRIMSIMLDIDDSGNYSVFKAPTKDRILTDKYEKLPVESNIGIVYNLSDRVYSESTILGWFDCDTLAELKSKIKNSDMFYMTYINLDNKAYRIPIQFIELKNSDNQLYVVTEGLSMTDDMPCRYVITANLDGTIIEGQKNVQVVKEPIAMAATTLEGYGIEDAYTKDETDAAIAEAKPILVNIPISGEGSILRNEPNKVYEASTVFSWFGVEDNEALKALIFSGRPMYVRQGLSIAGVPSYYMMPIVYIGYTVSNANKLEMSIIGNDTTNDKTIKYHVNINLDGTLLSDVSNITVKRFYLDPKPAFAVGTEAPDDTDQLWLDSTTKAIKYYDANTLAWVDFGTFSA